jgi:GR25 family glycosyltransferase involved in LPS biosynthesis
MKCKQAKQLPAWMGPRPLTEGEVSVLLKHYWAITAIANGNEPMGLILEDDVRCGINSSTNFRKVLQEFIAFNGDYLDLAGGCNLKACNQLDERKRLIHILGMPRTRTNAAYIIRKDLALYISNMFLPLIFPIDWHIQLLFPTSARACWAIEPPLIHGSECGIVKSWRA